MGRTAAPLRRDVGAGIASARAPGAWGSGTIGGRPGQGQCRGGHLLGGRAAEGGQGPGTPADPARHGGHRDRSAEQTGQRMRGAVLGQELSVHRIHPDGGQPGPVLQPGRRPGPERQPSMITSIPLSMIVKAAPACCPARPCPRRAGSPSNTAWLPRSCLRPGCSPLCWTRSVPLPDPRAAHLVIHPWPMPLGLVACTLLCGVRSVRGVIRWANGQGAGTLAALEFLDGAGRTASDHHPHPRTRPGGRRCAGRRRRRLRAGPHSRPAGRYRRRSARAPAGHQRQDRVRRPRQPRASNCTCSASTRSTRASCLPGGRCATDRTRPCTSSPRST